MGYPAGAAELFVLILRNIKEKDMNVYKIRYGALLRKNSYPGGIIVGKSKNGKYAVYAYFIMGRARQPQRVFDDFGDYVTIFTYEAAKLDPRWSPPRQKLGGG